MKRLKIMVIAGARPNFMKVAPLLKAIDANDPANSSFSFDCRLVHTGQHYDQKMSDVFFSELGIKAPDINLEVGSDSHAVQTATIMSRFEPICQSESPDWIVVVGDVNSTMACTLVAAKLGIKVAHLEAGLRSFDRTMPEEVNRIVTDALADLLLTPAIDANENLKREGVSEQKIKLVGNIMIDTLVENLAKGDQRKTLEMLDLTEGDFVYVTLHRPSNVDASDSLHEIMRELSALSHQMPVVFPMHPRTKKMLSEFKVPMSSSNGLKVIDPIGYHDSLNLTKNARLVLTDSGGLQEESTYFRTPCLTLRPNTERPITITLGSNKLTSISKLRSDIEQALSSSKRIGTVPPLWDGQTAKRTVQEIITASNS
ncbi:MAG TPA: UDP-N-acetylglucosamine 2-epimerase (non-hydrolyzing) [Candidatus Udaeobacter sp.]|jgi:UDP-N-acetylglucosamine 2-epimerase (non-hydrolysing)|nr:UDP-N-acetylglucosamine 2-epimerase (non-hydrolyzing) [Candidatus Udaeobacter sp.]